MSLEMHLAIRWWLKMEEEVPAAEPGKQRFRSLPSGKRREKAR